ncbi:MAG TPA: transcription antitermination factor NusB [Rhizomicrobium sp.]|jgi:N utilization substance protein B|nr:transcription antitermination factor NusB [Rhizomicrobium sp.]
MPGTSQNNPGGGRRPARLAAVQALYQMEVTGSDAETVAQEFCEHRFRDEECTDEPLFRRIVAGVPHHQVDVDRAIASSLSKDWKLQRIDSILRAILRAAAFELIARDDVPARVVIDEYIEIARRFFDGDECGFVNAVLDRLAHAHRAAEFDGPARDDLQA